MFFKKKITISHLTRKLSHVIGIVLVWRGIWIILDELDTWFFGGSHLWTGIIGAVIGFLILYLPDREDLTGIDKL